MAGTGLSDREPQAAAPSVRSSSGKIEGAVIAARVGVPVISDFRPADMAAGGKGAPLVPYLDYLLFRDAHVGRILQNIGGIANLTAIPAGADASRVFAFDTGPGNMVIDAVTETLFGRAFDRGGKIAASGKVLETVVDRIMKGDFFRSRPPKTAGREEFGREFVREFLRRCGRSRPQDVVATATALTVRSIVDAVRRFVIARSGGADSPREMIVSGGGAHNPQIMGHLAAFLPRVTIATSSDFGVDVDAKEAIAFAILAYETWRGRPSNLPSATGARSAVLLGSVTPTRISSQL